LLLFAFVAVAQKAVTLKKFSNWTEKITFCGLYIAKYQQNLQAPVPKAIAQYSVFFFIGNFTFSGNVLHVQEEQSFHCLYP